MQLVQADRWWDRGTKKENYVSARVVDKWNSPDEEAAETINRFRFLEKLLLNAES